MEWTTKPIKEDKYDTNKKELAKTLRNSSQVFLVLILCGCTFIFGYFFGNYKDFEYRKYQLNQTITDVQQKSIKDNLSGLINSIKGNKSEPNNNESKSTEVTTPIDSRVFDEVYNIIKNDYVSKEIDDNKLKTGAIKGMVSSLGDFATAFYSKEDTDSYEKMAGGEYFGIGAELGYQDSMIIVKNVLPNSPAEKSGIKNGYIIKKVDSLDITPDMNVTDIVQKIRGKKDTSVLITFITNLQTNEEKKIDITRGEIHTQSINTFDEANNIMRIRLTRFTENTLEEFENQWNETVKQVINKNPSALILDLRGNPGGFLEGANFIAQDFLPKGSTVLLVKDRDGIKEKYVSEIDGRLKDYKMVVLVDAGSASASEILSGALQVNNRAKLYGEKTFGKGTAQQVIKPSNWNGASLHLTVQKWLLPNEKEINHESPIVPDIEVKTAIEDIKKGIDPVKDRALADLIK